MPRVIFVGGGSIGHVAPCLAVWQAAQELDPTAEAHFLCAERDAEQKFLKKAGVTFSTLPLPHRSLEFPTAFARAFFGALTMLRAFAPDVVFSKGGALSIPACLAAYQKGIPIVLHESDAVMGRANRFLSRWANTVCLGWPSSSHPSYFIRHTSYVTVTGNPIRHELTQGSREEGLRLTGFSGTRPVLLVLGGSQGAQAINEVVVQALPELLRLCDVVHITGKGKARGPSQHGYYAIEFAYEELPHLYAIASLALSRAGAGGISELAANGIPAILVPLRGLAQDHQAANARRAEESGGCMVVAQEDLPRSLVPLLRKILGEPSLRQAMSQRMRRLSTPDAAKHIAQQLLES